MSTRLTPHRLSLCTDEGVVDIVDEGGVDFAVKRAIAESVDPIEAIQIATLNTAQIYNRPFGHVDPGALADLMLLDDLESWDVAHDVDGKLDPTARDGPTAITSLRPTHRPSPRPA